MKSSTSEDNGVSYMSKEDLKIYSVGISTAGVAEMRMAQQNPERQIIATTIDPIGLSFAEKYLQEVSSQVTLKLEDVSKPLPYPEGHFDYIYARLVLHYLPKPSLETALKELHRILRPKGRLFITVRSIECSAAISKDRNPVSGLTTYISPSGSAESRYFHTEQSIQAHLKDVGFDITHAKTYDEQLCEDFEREVLTSEVDSLIEVLASC